MLGFDDPDLVAQARAVGVGEQLIVEGLWLERDEAPTAFELVRYDVWAPDAIVEVDGALRSPPDSRHFRGGERNFLDSTVLLTVAESGEVDGLVLRGDRAWVIGKGRGRSALESRRADLASPRQFECGLDELTPHRRGAPASASFPGASATSPHTAETHSGEPYHATLAIDTDYEYYARFLSRPDPAAAALDYLALVVGYGDVVYSREIDTSMGIGFARLWTAGASSDPWTATSDTLSALNQFRAYWNANQAPVERTTAHFFSGKNLGGGIAYLGALCSNYDTPGSSFDYGLSANISGSFDWNGSPGTNPAATVWDIFVVLHELGHNFDAEHTHDFCGLGGSGSPVDRCFAGCAGAAQGLPSCSSPTPHFAGGAGTIMSYCHLQGDGIEEVSLTFGEGHTCGELPDRVSQWMSDYVATRAAARPACFATAESPVLFVTRTGNGSGTVTSSPAGISCGSICHAEFGSGTVVTLTAVAASGSTFTGWSGGGCSGTGTCAVTLNSPTSVFAEFSAPESCVDDGFEGLGSSGGNDLCWGGEMGAGTSQTHALCDDDWVYFTAEAGRTYRIETTNLTGGADTVLHLHDNCGPQIATNDDFDGLASRIDWTATADIPADIRVRNFGNVYGAQRGYTISVTCIAGCGGGCPEHLTLNGVTSSVETIKAAQTITASDYDVLAPGDVTLHAGTLVSLGNGFSVASGARLTVLAGTTPSCP